MIENSELHTIFLVADVLDSGKYINVKGEDGVISDEVIKKSGKV